MIKTAILGAGKMGNRHAEALSRVSGAKLIAVNDAVQGRAEKVAAEYGAVAYADPRIAAEMADVVYVLTPPSSHRELAVMAMQAHKHVVCEKPLAISVEDGRAMVETAQEMGVHLMVAFNMRFKKGFRMLREVIDSGRLGEIYHFWSHRMGMGVGQGYNWRTDPELLCGMTIESLSHDIDLMRWLVGDPVDVRATVHERRPELPGFDTETIAVFALRGGGTALIHASWSSHLGTNSRGLLGAKGAAMSEGPGLWESRYLHVKTEDMDHESITVLDDPLDADSYIAENEHFIDCLAKGLRPAVTGEDGLRALEISHAMLRAHRENRVVELG